MKKFLVLHVLSVSLVLFCVTLLYGETWHMKTGSSVEADEALVNGQFVEFQLKNGKTTRTKIDNLTDEDRVKLLQLPKKKRKTLDKNANRFTGEAIAQEIHAKHGAEVVKLTKLAEHLRQSNYPYCILKAQAQFDRKLIVYSGSEATVSYTVTITFDEERFDDIIQPILPLLEELSSKKQQGIIRQVQVPLQKTRPSFRDSLATEVIEYAFGENAFPARASDNDVQLYINTSRTFGLKSTQWMAYMIPVRSNLLLNLMEKTIPAVRVSFLDDNGREITYRYVHGINDSCAASGIYAKDCDLQTRDKHNSSESLRGYFSSSTDYYQGFSYSTRQYSANKTYGNIHFMCPFGYTPRMSGISRGYKNCGQFFSKICV